MTEMLKFDEEHKLFRKSVRSFIEKEIRPYVEEWEEARRTPKELWKKCGALGFLGITYPEEYGGAAADHKYTLIFNEEMGGCGSSGVALGISVQNDMATPALAKYGNEHLKKNYLVPAIKGEMVTSIAVSEPNHGSNVAGIQTRAILKDGDYVINGRKTFITNGSQSDFLTLLARTGDPKGYQGLSLFVVPSDVKGFSRGKILKKTCYHASDTAEIVLEDVHIPKENLIGEEGKGFIYQMEQFQFERLAGVQLALGAMKRAYKLTKKYIQEREVFGRPLYKMQVTQHKMAQMISEISMVEAMTHRCVALANMGVDFTKDVTMLKLMAAQIVQKVSEECVQLHGGYGLMHEYEVARSFVDAKLLGIGGGTNEVMKEIIVKMEGLS